LRAKIHEVLDDRSYILEGIISKPPITIAGGHIIFELSQTAHPSMRTFEPTKGFRRIIRELLPGDDVTVFWECQDRTMNLEKIKLVV